MWKQVLVFDALCNLPPFILVRPQMSSRFQWQKRNQCSLPTKIHCPRADTKEIGKGNAIAGIPFCSTVPEKNQQLMCNWFGSFASAIRVDSVK